MPPQAFVRTLKRDGCPQVFARDTCLVSHMGGRRGFTGVKLVD